MSKKFKLSAISTLHYFKLVYRSVLFLSALAYWITSKFKGVESPFDDAHNAILIIVGLVLTIEMVFRFFPSRLESMGCQKQFKRNMRPTDETVPKTMSWKRTLLVASVWILLNSVFVGLYHMDVYDSGVLILLSLLYSVCDMICILFFCPFQTWFMKNKCCNTCRIYNWDYAMMCTPLIFIDNPITIALTVMSLILLAEWEILYKLYPERFVENCNASLACVNCREKLCYHKKQLRGYLKKGKFNLKGNAITLIKRKDK